MKIQLRVPLEHYTDRYAVGPAVSLGLGASPVTASPMRLALVSLTPHGLNLTQLLLLYTHDTYSVLTKYHDDLVVSVYCDCVVCVRVSLHTGRWRELRRGYVTDCE